MANELTGMIQRGQVLSWTLGDEPRVKGSEHLRRVLSCLVKNLDLTLKTVIGRKGTRLNWALRQNMENEKGRR